MPKTVVFVLRMMVGSKKKHRKFRNYATYDS